MYTIEDIYNYLIDGTEPVISSTFMEPTAGPGATMKSTKDIYDDTRAKFDSCDAAPEKVLEGVTFFRTDPSDWGPREGTMENRGEVTYTPATTEQTVDAGYHNGSGKVQGDANLVTGNIKAGVSIFGVNGDPNVVDTSSGTATHADILYGRKAWVDGSEVTGVFDCPTCPDAPTGNAQVGEVLSGKTFSNTSSTGLTGTMTNKGAGGTITPGTTDQTVAAGYWSSANTVSGDAGLVAGNIKSGASIFGVAGDSNVVDTTEANPVAAERMKTGDIAFVNGNKVTGNGTKTLSSANDTIDAGYYEATTLSAVDADLAAENIKKDVAIFGVTGRLVDASNATRVPKTGQEDCWNAGGGFIGCPGTGQDGEDELGVLPKVTPSSGVDGSYRVYGWTGIRFTDNLDGTVTDNLTGLIWLKDANCGGAKVWADALSYCNGLENGDCGLSDGSGAGDWRLPNINEMHSLVDRTQSTPALPENHPFTGVQSSYYWSSTTYESDTVGAWDVFMSTGHVSNVHKDFSDYVWPVRSDN